MYLLKCFFSAMWDKVKQYKKWVIIAVITKLVLLLFFAPVFGISTEAVVTGILIIFGLVCAFVVWCFHCAFSSYKAMEDLNKGI